MPFYPLIPLCGIIEHVHHSFKKERKIGCDDIANE